MGLEALPINLPIPRLPRLQRGPFRCEGKIGQVPLIIEGFDVQQVAVFLLRAEDLGERQRRLPPCAQER